MPLSFVGRGIEAAYESYNPFNKTSNRVNIGIFLGSKALFNDDFNKFFAFRFELQKRFYLQKNPYPKIRTYLSPYAQIKYVSIYLSPTNTLETGAFGLGAIFGTQVHFGSRLLIDMYVGAGYLIPSDRDVAYILHSDLINPYSRGGSLHGGIGLGLITKKRKL
jgi:hypothetical protein